MTEQITLKEALGLVTFTQWGEGGWRVKDVFGTVRGDINGSVEGDIYGSVRGDINGYVRGDIEDDVGGNIGGDVGGDIDGCVGGDIGGDVGGYIDGYVGGNIRNDVLGMVYGKRINGHEWKLVETPKEELQRLVNEDASKEQLLAAINKLEDN